MSRTAAFAKVAATCAGALLLAVSPLGNAADYASAVKGTGGSSSARVLAQWNFQFTKETKINVQFDPANSGVGIREIIARNVDFGATEIPLSAEELAKNDLVQFPLLIGGVVVIVNIPGVKPGELRLSSSLLTKIFLGQTTAWNDREIQALNPDLKLPKLPIRLVVRETPASTTLALTDFLSKTDNAWATRIGASQLPAWPAPVSRAVTVQAMGDMVQATPGAIGYLNVDEAYRKQLSYVQMRNRAGQWVKPSHETILAAAASGGLARNVDRIPTLVDVDGSHSWPIVEVTYVLMDRKPKSVDRARSTLKFFFWAFLQGDQMAHETGFVPLPTTAQARVVGRFRDVVTPNHMPVAF